MCGRVTHNRPPPAPLAGVTVVPDPRLGGAVWQQQRPARGRAAGRAVPSAALGARDERHRQRPLPVGHRVGPALRRPLCPRAQVPRARGRSRRHRRRARQVQLATQVGRSCRRSSSCRSSSFPDVFRRFVSGLVVVQSQQPCRDLSSWMPAHHPLKQRTFKVKNANKYLQIMNDDQVERDECEPALILIVCVFSAFTYPCLCINATLTTIDDGRATD